MNKKDIVELINGINGIYLNYILLFLIGMAIGMWVVYILWKANMLC